MSNKARIIAGLILPLFFESGASLAAEFSNLFTTPQEREIINAKRYQSQVVKPPTSAQSEAEQARELQLIYGEDKTMRLQISGITLTADGANSVWINQKIYANGSEFEDGSKIAILTGKDVRVRITTPDGQKHFATSGDVLEITYRTPADLDQ